MELIIKEFCCIHLITYYHKDSCLKYTYPQYKCTDDDTIIIKKIYDDISSLYIKVDIKVDISL